MHLRSEKSRWVLQYSRQLCTSVTLPGYLVWLPVHNSKQCQDTFTPLCSLGEPHRVCSLTLIKTLIKWHLPLCGQLGHGDETDSFLDGTGWARRIHLADSDLVDCGQNLDIYMCIQPCLPVPLPYPPRLHSLVGGNSLRAPPSSLQGCSYERTGKLSLGAQATSGTCYLYIFAK